MPTPSITCPKCSATLPLEIEDSGRPRCMNCGYASDASPIVAGESPRIDSRQTGIQSEARGDAANSPIDADAEIKSARVVLYGREILTMFGIRFISPAAWVVAIGMFFLPWVDMKCIDRNGDLVLHSTVTGAQMIIIEQTVHHPKDPPKPVPARRNGVDQRTVWEITAQCLLGVYIVALTGGLILKIYWLTRSPSYIRAILGVFVSLLLFSLLLAGCWVLLQNPLHPPGSLPWEDPPREPGRDQIIMRYTYWYYASYLANLLAVLGFALEFWYVRRLRRKHSSSNGGLPA